MRKKKNIVELTRYSDEEYRSIPKLPFILAADNVRSMHNVGSFFRTGDAFLIEEIILGGISGAPPHPEITKTALGAENTVRWSHVDNLYGELLKLKRDGWKVYVLEQTHDSTPLDEFVAPADAKIVLVVGNEVSGVDQKIIDIADEVLEIPQYGTKHSLNVSVSAGIAIYSLLARHR